MRYLWLSRRSIIVIFTVAITLWLLWFNWSTLIHVLKFSVDPKYRRCVYNRASYEKQTPLYVTLKQHGRIGNWMFAYASLLGIAEANDYIPYLPSDHILTEIFQLSHKKSKYFADCQLVVTDPMPCGLAKSFYSLPAANISIDGYLQSWKYFQFIGAKIRKEFSFQERYERKIKRAFLDHVSSYLKEGRVVISIHVRRGDYLSDGAHSLGFKPAPLEYFHNSMAFMAEKYPHSVFLVVSDDMQWCKENLTPVSGSFSHEQVLRSKNADSDLENKREEGDNNVDNDFKEEIPMVYSSKLSSVIDFGLLTMANHSIMSVGTFSWWGAWMANGTTVYYDDFVIPGSTLDSQTVREDYLPPHWIPMSSSTIISLDLILIFLLLVILMNVL